MSFYRDIASRNYFSRIAVVGVHSTGKSSTIRDVTAVLVAKGIPADSIVVRHLVSSNGFVNEYDQQYSAEETAAERAARVVFYEFLGTPEAFNKYVDRPHRFTDVVRCSNAGPGGCWVHVNTMRAAEGLVPLVYDDIALDGGRYGRTPAEFMAWVTPRFAPLEVRTAPGIVPCGVLTDAFYTHVFFDDDSPLHVADIVDTTLHLASASMTPSYVVISAEVLPGRLRATFKFVGFPRRI